MRKLHFFSTLVALVFATTQIWAEAPTGALPGGFTVNNAGKKVFFSKGNLQYIGSAATPYWKFADHQYDFLGTSTGQNSDAVNVDRDLFGWGTSGWNSGANAYQPWSTNYTNSDYLPGGSASNNLTGDYANADWGVYNVISNGGDRAGLWRTLSGQEWTYVGAARQTGITIKSTDNARYTCATINTIIGIILIPDGYNGPTSDVGEDIIWGTINAPSEWETKCSTAGWTTLENKGCVFLPASGCRFGTTVTSLNWVIYWSSTAHGSTQADCGTRSNAGSVQWSVGDDRMIGRAVRLIQDCPAAEITEAPNAKTLYYTGSAQTLVTAGEATGGTMYYKLNSGAWSTSIPTGIAKATYAVYYKAVGDATHSDSEEFGPINVTILNPQATISNPPTAKSPLIYTGGELELVNAGSGVSGGTLKYSLDGNTWRTEIPTASALGDYNVYWKLEGDASHSDYIPEPAYITVSITIPTVSDDADPSTVLSNLYNNGTSTQLKIERTIYRNGEYNTICLPFALNESALASSPLAGFNNLKTIKGASISGTAPDLSIDIFVEDVTEMEAGKPYLISYPSANENIVDPVFTGITVTETSPGSVTADGITFRGMFAQVHIDPYTAERDEDYLFLGANSQLMWPNNDGSSMRGFRAYFIIDRTVITPAAAPSGTRARFVNAPKQPTAIENTELNTQAQKLLENGQLIILKNGIKYNAQGQVLK